MVNLSKSEGTSRAFKRAEAHSKRVLFIRRALPVMAVGILVFGGAAWVVAQNVPHVSVDLPQSTISDGKLVMANPKLDGFTKDRRPYRVTANRAIQDLSGSTEMELDTLRADVEMENGGTARLVSSVGTFDNTTNMLFLPEEAVLTMSDGMRAILGQSKINIQAGSVEATGNVDISNNETKITASQMQFSDGGRHIVFERNVRVILTPKSNQTAATGMVSTGN